MIYHPEIGHLFFTTKTETMKPSTVFAGKSSPFTAVPRAKKIFAFVDADSLTITNDPLPKRRASPNKYSVIFDKLKIGQCVKCEPNEAAKVAHALTVWLKKIGKTGRVKSTCRYDDGKGRVWLL